MLCRLIPEHNVNFLMMPALNTFWDHQLGLPSANWVERLQMFFQTYCRASFLELVLSYLENIPTCVSIMILKNNWSYLTNLSSLCCSVGNKEFINQEETIPCKVTCVAVLLFTLLLTKVKNPNTQEEVFYIISQYLYAWWVCQMQQEIMGEWHVTLLFIYCCLYIIYIK